MARIKKGQILGSLKDVTIYEADGKIVVARKVGFNKKQYNSYESLEGHRKRSKEFKFCSHLSKLIRLSLNDYKYVFNTKISSGLTGQIQLVCKNDFAGKLGQRKIDVKTNGRVIENYSLSKRVFNTLSLVPFEISITEDRKLIRLLIREFMPLSSMSPPTGTNCFNIFMTATLVNPFEYNQDQNEYLPELDKGFSFSKTVVSDNYNNLDMVVEGILEIAFEFTPEHEHGLIVCLGVEFFDAFTNRVSTNTDWAAMKILKVA